MAIYFLCPPPKNQLYSYFYCKYTKRCNAVCSCRIALIKFLNICTNFGKRHSCTNSPTECDTDTVEEADGNEKMLLLGENINNLVEEKISMAADDATFRFEIDS